jgi:hypothetical protein
MPTIFYPTTIIDFGLREILGGAVLYAYLAFTTMVLAHRLGLRDGWMAWFPIANLYLLTKMTDREWWWLIGFVVPYVNFFVVALLWYEIAVRFNKNGWIGSAIILPVIGIFVPAYLVIAGARETASS